MKLKIVSPVDVIVDEENVTAVRAEDASGGFGILQGHTDFLTVLAVSVVSWTRNDGTEGHAAVRGGVMEAHDGETISVATREAVVGASLGSLRDEVLARFHETSAFDEMSKTSTAKLNLALIRQLQRYLQAGRTNEPLQRLDAGGDGA